MLRRTLWMAAMLLWAAAGPALSQSADDAMAMLIAGRYEDLEARFQAAQASYKRGESSDEQLLASFRPFYDVSNPRYLTHLEEWVRVKPRSYVARLALGIHLKYIGLDARGSDPLSVTPDARVHAFRAAFRRASDVLGESLSLDDKPLLTYHHLIDPNGALPEFASNRQLLEKAVELDARTFIVRRKYLVTLPGRWGGSVEKMEEFVDQCRMLGFSSTQIAKLERDLDEERAYLAYVHGNHVDAERRYTRLVAQDPEDRKSRTFLMVVLAAQHKCDQVIALADKILSDNPVNAVALSNRGLCNVRQERFKAGIADYRAAAELGNAWAQKELARLHWEGRLVEKDRKLALDLLRKASESGDPEAQRQFQTATGERISVKASVRDVLAPITWASLPFIAIGVTGAFIRRRVSPEIAARRLQFTLWRYWGAVLCMVILGGALLLTWLTPHLDPLLPFWLLVLAGAIIWLIVDAARTLLMRHDLSNDGIRSSGWGRAVEMKWAEVVRFDYLHKKSAFHLSGPYAREIRIHQAVGNIEVFAQEALAHVAVMGEEAYYTLKEILDPNFFSAWEEDEEDDVSGDVSDDTSKS